MHKYSTSGTQQRNTVSVYSLLQQDAPQEDDEEQKMQTFLQEVESLSENLIGLDEAHTHDPLRQILSLQKHMQLLQKDGQTLLRRQAKLHSNSEEMNDFTHSLCVAVQGASSSASSTS